MWTYHTHLFLEIGLFKIEWYRLLAILATIIGLTVTFNEAKRRKLNIRHTAYVAIGVLAGMIIGSRFFYYFGPWTWNKTTPFMTRFIQFIHIEGSGMVYYGGLIGAIIAVIICTKMLKIDYFRYLDAFAPGTALAYFIARIGCFLGGCCYGKRTDVPWAVIRNGTPIHPTQIYMSLNGLVMFFLILYLNKKERKPGFIACSAALYYSISRFIIEFFRFNNYYFIGLSSSQWISIALFLISITILIRKYDFLKEISNLINSKKSNLTDNKRRKK